MKLRLWHLFLLLTIAAGSDPAFSAMWQWSKTAGNNATADPTINWAVGMAPSAVDASARAQMARQAEYRDDISGALSAGGTAAAQTLSTNQAAGGNGICSNGSPPTNGQMIAFVPTFSNVTGSTMQVDSCSAYPYNSSATVALPAGTLVVGTPYRMAFNLANLAWVLEGGYANPYNTPLGGILLSTVSTPPNSNFIVPAGQCISTTTYAAYFSALGSPASGGCAGGTWPVIDARGRNLTPLDNIGGTAASRLTNSATGCGVAFTSLGATCSVTQSTTLAISNLPTITTPLSVSGSFPGSGGIYTGSAIANFNAQISGGGTVNLPSNTGGGYGTFTSLTSTGTGTSNSTTDTPFPNVSPNVGVYAYLRVI